jgi:gamma-glutamylcysteine synthetase
MQPVEPARDDRVGAEEAYRIMGPYMPTVGTWATHDEATPRADQHRLSRREGRHEKFRTGMGLAPLLIAMFANSPICDGSSTATAGYREHIWTDTAKSRKGC